MNPSTSSSGSIDWYRQGEAVVGNLLVRGNRRGKVVLIPPAATAAGVMLLLPAEGGQSVNTLPLLESLELLTPAQVIEILCAHERIFGSGRLPALSIP